MEYEERIKSILTELEHCYISYDNLHGNNEQGVKIIEEALKKQNAEKMKYKEQKPYCPRCKMVQDSVNHYCWFCGQKLSWEIDSDEWIPVSTALPNESENVLITWEDKDGEQKIFISECCDAHMIGGVYGNGRWWRLPQYHSQTRVKAWKRLPEPYKEDKE